MIITNFIAKIVVKIASYFTPGTIGVTIYPFIFIYPLKYKNNKKLINHEKIHLMQWKKYWIVGFFPLYIYYHIKYGYINNPLEIEARNNS